MFNTEEVLIKHSHAYAQIINLIELSRYHKEHCAQSNCGVSIYLVKQVVDKLIRYTFPQERQDIILKVQEFKWL